MNYKSKTLWLLLLILIIASFLRLYQITTVPPGLYPDEAMNGNNALEALHDTPPNGGFKVFYPENNGREGLFINIQALFLKFFGTSTRLSASINEPWVLRLPSAIFGILTVLGIYFLAAKLFSAEVGLLSAFLLATSYWHVNFSRIGFRAIMAPFFLTWAIYFLVKGLEHLQKDGRLWHAMLWHIIGGVVFGLGFYSYIAYRVSPILVAGIVLFFWLGNKDATLRRKILFSAFLGFTFSAFIVALPIGIYYLKNPADFLGRTSQVSIFSSVTPAKDLALNILKTAGMFNIRGDYNWRHNLAGQPELLGIASVLFLVGLAVSLRRFNPGNFKNWSFFNDEIVGHCILFGWMLLAALPVVISNEGLPHALRSILMIPPVIIWAGLGGIWLYNKLKTLGFKNNLILIICLLPLIALVLKTYHAYFILWAKNPNTQAAFSENYVALGKKLNAMPREIKKYVVVNADGVLVRGIPMPTQTVMFITDTFDPENQKAKNIYYVLPGEEKNIPPNAAIFYLQLP